LAIAANCAAIAVNYIGLVVNLVFGAVLKGGGITFNPPDLLAVGSVCKSLFWD